MYNTKHVTDRRSINQKINKMRRVTVHETRLLKINNSYEGKSIEKQLQAMMAGEAIETKGKSMIYTEKKEGVLPETDIRSDRFKLAQDAVDYVNKTNIAKRDELNKKEQEGKKEGGVEGKQASTSETIQGTGTK